jgi:hypothetical protein
VDALGAMGRVPETQHQGFVALTLMVCGLLHRGVRDGRGRAHFYSMVRHLEDLEISVHEHLPRPRSFRAVQSVRDLLGGCMTRRSVSRESSGRFLYGLKLSG